MFVIILLITAAMAAASDRPYFHPELAEQHFEDYIVKFNKVYANEEEKQRRFEIFKDNLNVINARNKNSSSIHGFTPFTDWTLEEFDKLNGHISLPNLQNTACSVQTDADFPSRTAPESHDWRTQNVVTSIKNQGDCGACWAFSVTGNVESQYLKTKGQSVLLSEQQLVDCDDTFRGCKGGIMDVAMGGLIDSGGLELEADYAYRGVQQTCAFDRSKVKVRITGCTRYTFQSEEVLKEALYTVGPLSIAIYASGLGTYTGELVDRDRCPEGTPANHAVLLVGYGSENGVPVWYIKNSWGDVWGNRGYMTMKRNANMCGIMEYAMASATVA